MSSDDLTRLQKVLAQAGVASRRGSENLISDGRVSVNGEIIREMGVKITPGVDVVSVDGKPVCGEPLRLYRFYKPAGVITTMKDHRGRRNVGDFSKTLPVQAFPVGRLDIDVTGLLLFTNAGKFAHEMLHPSYSVPRVYLALVNGCPGSDVFSQLIKGVELDCGFGQATSARNVEISQDVLRLFGSVDSRSSIIEITVTLGRKHFVKKILYAVGYPVEKLCRIAFGSYSLSGLKPGEFLEAEFSRPK